VCTVLKRIINEGILECHIQRFLVDKLPDEWEAGIRQPREDIVIFGDVLPDGITPQLAGALGWTGLGNWHCLGRREWDHLRESGGLGAQEILDDASQL
jgi:hypothetical protein